MHVVERILRDLAGRAVVDDVPVDVLRWPTVEGADERAARLRCDRLRAAGKALEGLRYVRGRVERLGREHRDSQPWVTLVATLEDYGHPDHAVAALAGVGKEKPDDPVIQAFTAGFWARQGAWPLAERALQAAEAGSSRERYLSAAVPCARLRGCDDEALVLAREAADLTPSEPGVLAVLLEVTAAVQGDEAELAEARRRCTDEEPSLLPLLYERLGGSGLHDEALALVRRYVERWPTAPWGWSALAASPMQAEARRAIDELRGLDDQTAAVAWLEARFRRTFGGSAEATAAYREALATTEVPARDLDDMVKHLRGLSPDEHDGWLEAATTALERLAVPCCVGLRLGRYVAERLGYSSVETLTQRLSERRPWDWAVVETRAVLAAEYAVRPDVGRRMAEELVPVIERHPAVVSLRHAAKYVVSRWPADGTALVGLHRLGRRTLDDLGRAAAAQPWNPALVAGHGRALVMNGRADEAAAVLTKAVARRPAVAALRTTTLQALFAKDADEWAVEFARDAAERYPQSASCRAELGEALRRSRTERGTTEAEAAYRQALSLQADQPMAVEGLAMLLSGQRRDDEAAEVLQTAIRHSERTGRLRLLQAAVERRHGDRKGARVELGKLLGRKPHLQAGWLTAVAWLEEDEAWDEAKGLLGPAPATAFPDADGAVRRIRCLERGGLGGVELDDEWSRALARFPDDRVLRRGWYDRLVAGGRWDEAGAVLGPLAAAGPADPAARARGVQQQGHDGDGQGAAGGAVDLWTSEDDGDGEADETAWRALSEVAAIRQPCAALYERFRRGDRIRFGAFARLVESLVLVDGQPTGVDGLHGRLINRLADMLQRLHVCPWDDGRYKAVVLDRLAREKAMDEVFAYWNQFRDVCRRQTPVWTTLGAILVAAPAVRWELVRDWLRDWRDHEGVAMATVADYLTSLRRTKWPAPGQQLEECHRTAHDALERLEPDERLPYVACVLCEATLRRGADDEFLRWYRRYEHVLAEPAVPDDYAIMPAVVGAFARMLEGDEGTVMAATDELRQRVGDHPPPWLADQWLTRTATRVSSWQQAKLYVKLRWAQMLAED